jgi:phi13 family phage major tail protein
MTVQAAEKKSVIGLRDLYIGWVTQDDADAYAAEAPTIFAPAVTASHKPTSNSKTQYADDGQFDVIINEGETQITLEVTNIPLSVLAWVLGKVFDAATGRMFDDAGTPPDVALSFRSKKSNGSYKYYQYLKGKFSTPEEEQATMADSPDPKTIKIIYTAIKTTYLFDLIGDGSVMDGAKRVVGDEDATDFDGDTWFDAVQVPVAGAPAAFTCTPSPVDGAAAQAVGVAIVLTFSNPLAGGVEKGVALVRQDTSAAITLTRSLSADRTVLTLGHASLTGAKTYNIVLAGVSDMYGQTLVDTVYDFATA